MYCVISKIKSSDQEKNLQSRVSHGVIDGLASAVIGSPLVIKTSSSCVHIAALDGILGSLGRSLLELVHHVDLLFARGSSEINAGTFLHVHVLDVRVGKWVSIREVHHGLGSSLGLKFIDIGSS